MSTKPNKANHLLRVTVIDFTNAALDRKILVR
jgi:hypothetical protein